MNPGNPGEHDDELFDTIRNELFTAVIGDVMDAQGLRRQFLPPQIRPLADEMIVCGRAMPVLEADCHGQAIGHSGTRQPFGLMLQALDDLRPGEVYLCTGASPTYALWGALMTTRALKLGAVGAVVDGYSRDTSAVLKLGMSVFSWGGYAQDQGVRGRVIDFRCPVEFGNGVIVNPGDLVVGDRDGVVVVPKDHVPEIITLALEKARGEQTVGKALEAGMSAQEAFATYGIL